MTCNRWVALGALIMASACGAVALGQNYPTAPRVPQVAPPPPVASPGPVPPAEAMAATELRIALQKAQVQSTLADHVAEVKEDAIKTLQAKANGGVNVQEDVLAGQIDAIGARAAADVAKVDVASLDAQNRAGPAALEQAQSLAMPQQNGLIPPASPLIAQLMQFDFRKAQIQAAAAAQIVPLKQRIYDLLVEKQKVGTATVDKVTDAVLDLEIAKAAAQTTALDQQLMAARLAAAGVKQP